MKRIHNEPRRGFVTRLAPVVRSTVASMLGVVLLMLATASSASATINYDADLPPTVADAISRAVVLFLAFIFAAGLFVFFLGVLKLGGKNHDGTAGNKVLIGLFIMVASSTPVIVTDTLRTAVGSIFGV